MNVLVVGSVALDTLETPSGKREEMLGGSATYFSVSCSNFAPVRLVAVVGEDFPPAHLKLLREKGIDTEGLEVRPGKTFRWGGSYLSDLNQADTHFTHLNVFETFQPSLPPGWEKTDGVFLANIDPVLQLQVLDQMKRPQLVAGDTMNLWIKTKPDRVKDAIERMDLLFINDAEARQLTQEANLPKAARRLLAMGPRFVVIKKGEHGAVLYSRKETFCAPALPLEKVVDPTGAGDTFAGGCVGYIARRGCFAPAVLRRAVIYGSVMASFAVEDFSLNRLRRVGKADIVARYQRFKKLTCF
jgi:sugar/nucleoside kinase (ribokinase family)